MKTLNTVDLFCGAGGASTGMEAALSSLQLSHRGLAINHWSVAVDTMRANHPDIDTKQMSIEEAVPADLVPGGEVDLLWASPSCTHHSRAKGGKPRSNQLRAQPELILTWLDQLFVRRLIIENVPEFIDWGPLTKDGRPSKSGKGACFRKWIEAIEVRNYKCEWRILNCADYGDATTRRRFFLQAVRKGCGKISWPEPTHAENPETDLWGHTPKRWRGVRECLDFSDLGRSIFNRKSPLADNTLRRIAVGLRKYDGIDFQMDMLGSSTGDDSRVRPLTAPLPPQHAGGNRSAVVRPFIVKLNNGADAEDIDEPLTSVLAGGQHHALCTPFIVRANRGCFSESVDAPLSSEQAHTCHHALCQPIVLDHFRNGEATDGSAPIGALTTHDRYSVVTPFVVEHRKNGSAKSLDTPIGAQTTKDKFSICTPLVMGQQSGAAAKPVTEPCPTIATGGAVRVVTPVVLDMSHPGDTSDERRVIGGDEPMHTLTTRNNSAMATPVILDMSRPGGNDSGHIGSADEPIRTITSFDNMQVAIPLVMDEAVGLPRLPDGRYLDIRIRMLKPSELAAAHSFPPDYKLTGNRGEQVKQIGNSVPVQTAKAIVRAMLESLAA